MKIAPGYASLPARLASINGRLMKPGALEATRTQGFSREFWLEQRNALMRTNLFG